MATQQSAARTIATRLWHELRAVAIYVALVLREIPGDVALAAANVVLNLNQFVTTLIVAVILMGAGWLAGVLSGSSSLG